MFTSLSSKIRRLHWGAQILLFPLLGVLWLVHNVIFRPLGWMATEASAQAMVGVKKVFAPLLWPLVIIAGLVVMLVAMGTQQFAQLMGPLLEAGVTFGVLGFVAYVAFKSVWPNSKKPTPRRRSRRP